MPEIEVSPTEGDFGFVAVGGAAILNMQLANRGCTALVIDEAVLHSSTAPAPEAQESAFSFVGRGPAPGDTIPPDPAAWFTLGVRFAPTAPGEACTTLQLRSNDPEQPDVSVRMCGTGS